MHTPRRTQWSPTATRQLLPDSRLANPRLARQRLARQRLTRQRLTRQRLTRQPLALRPRRPRLRLPASSGPSLPPFFAAHSRPILAPIFSRSRPGLSRLFRPRPPPTFPPVRSPILAPSVTDFLTGFPPVSCPDFRSGRRPSSAPFSRFPAPVSRPRRDHLPRLRSRLSINSFR